MFAIWLFVLGVFSAIYHPVGSAMLVTHTHHLGRDLDPNGVWAISARRMPQVSPLCWRRAPAGARPLSCLGWFALSSALRLPSSCPTTAILKASLAALIRLFRLCAPENAPSAVRGRNRGRRNDAHQWEDPVLGSSTRLFDGQAGSVSSPRGSRRDTTAARGRSF